LRHNHKGGTVKAVDICLIGAGPYGLALASHLSGSGRSVRVFGTPMNSWAKHMPQGMHLKSEGFASNLYDRQGNFPLQAYCAERGIPYGDIGVPVAIETFIGYGLEFQRRYVPELETVQITSVKQAGEGFEVTTAAGEKFKAHQVVVAAGIVNFAYVPPKLAQANGAVSHSSQHSDMQKFKGRRVAVIGGGASAIDVAMLASQAGADVDIIARPQALAFHDPPNEPRPLLERIKAPRSGLGTGWRSRMCTDMPLVFHALPESLRVKIVKRHLGPAPCWFTREAVDGQIRTHLGVDVENIRAENGEVEVVLRRGADGTEQRVRTGHVIAATGYKASVARLTFLDPSLASRIRTVDEAPALDRKFQSSVPGLYFIGAAAANSFGPLLRFAFGAKYAAQRVSSHLAA
jgi:thioredoxin reductase